jgi:transposase
MFTLPSMVQVFVCLQPTDMRKSFDSLAYMTDALIKQDPLSGHLFVFLNRGHNRIKILFWDRSGYCLYYKRLEAGTFTVPHQYDTGTSATMSLPELTLILEGIDLTDAKKRKRFSLKQTK